MEHDTFVGFASEKVTLEGSIKLLLVLEDEPKRAIMADFLLVYSFVYNTFLKCLTIHVLGAVLSIYNEMMKFLDVQWTWFVKDEQCSFRECHTLL